MADTQWKRVKPPLVRAGQSALKLSHPYPLAAEPWRRGLASQDTILAGRRVVLQTHTNGSHEWQIDNASTGGVSQAFPDPATWRTVAESQVELTAGSALELRVLAVPNGATETFILASGTFEQFGPSGAVRLIASYTNINGDTASVTVERAIPKSSPEVDGHEGTGAGESWGKVIHLHVGNIQPDTVEPAEVAKRSEWTRVHLALAYRGGARVIHACVQEVPAEHVIAHDNLDSTAHDWPEGLKIPFNVPQTKAADGATYLEPRFGPKRGLEVAERQSARLGPMIFTWTPHAERLAEPTDVDPDPVSISSTSWVGVVNATINAWSADAPGWDICAAYCKSPAENLTTRLRGNAATIPVRVWAKARFTTNLATKTGTIKLQTSPRSWVLLTIPESSTWAWYTITAYLEANVSSRDAYCILQPFARVSAGTMEIRYLCANYGANPVDLP